MNSSAEAKLGNSRRTTADKIPEAKRLAHHGLSLSGSGALDVKLGCTGPTYFAICDCDLDVDRCC